MKEIIKLLIEFPGDIWLMFITYLPGQSGFTLRYIFWRKRLKYLGKNSRIDTGVYFQNPNYIYIDDNTWIDKNVIILAGLDNSKREKAIFLNKDYKGEPGVVYIGKNVHVAPNCILSGISAGIYISDNCGFSANCSVYSFSHHYNSKKDPTKHTIASPMVSHDLQVMLEGPIYIGPNTWIALNSILLPGVSIAEDCFISINSIIYPGSKFTNNSIISGAPAKQIGKRFKNDE